MKKTTKSKANRRGRPPLDNLTGLPALIRARRAAKKLTVADLAALLGEPAYRVYAWEGGAYAPQLASLPALAAALDVPVERLLIP